MKERGIIMSGPLIPAILADEKKQTRRIIARHHFERASGSRWDRDWNSVGSIRLTNGEWRAYLGEYPGVSIGTLRSPYGVPGDRLYVKESFRVCSGAHKPRAEERRVRYKADGVASDWLIVPETHWEKPTSHLSMKWHTGRFMPRWASRIMLEVTDVRVERVQDISEEDAWAEGILTRYCCNGGDCGCRGMPINHPTADFRDLWDSINAKRGHGWDVNPWVWVVKFKRITP